MPRVTIADVAREASVSTMTVSRVINHKGEISQVTQERVQHAINKLDYRPNKLARSLTTRRTMTLGLLVPDITNPFFPEIVRGAEDTAEEQGYTLMLCNTGEDQAREAKTLRLLEDKQVDGVVLCSTRLPDDQLLPLIKRYPAAVLVNRSLRLTDFGVVQVDDAYGAMRAVHHLLSAGRRMIACLVGPLSSHSARKRIKGYTLALEATGRVADPALMRSCAPNEQGGYQGTKFLLEDHPEIDALVCYNDLMAIGALQVCSELGVHVPDDLSIVGCDDIRLASLVTPTLTSLRVSKYDIGANAVRMLLNKIEGRTIEKEMVLKPELIVRASAP